MKHSFFKSLALCVCSLVGFAASAYDFEVDSIYYLINSDETTVSVTYTSGYNSYSGDVTVPSTVTYDGTTYTVTTIGTNAFRKCTSLTSLSLPETVTTFGDNVFYQAFTTASSVTSYTMPSTITSIGGSTFYGCTGLTSVTLSSALTSMGTYTLSGCSALTEATIPDGITTLPDRTFNSCTNLATINLPNNVDTIGNYCFSSCKGLTTFSLPSSVTYMGNYCFYSCTGLTSFTFPSSLTYLGTYCFSGCTGLTSVALPDGMTYIPERTFTGCTGLTSVTLPSKLDSIGARAFYNCSALTSIELPSSLRVIGQYAFTQATGLTSITIPEGVTTIDTQGLSYCSALTEISLPSTLTTIGTQAFCYCTSLKSISIPNSVTSLGEGVVYYDSVLTSITLPENLDGIPSNTFYNCHSMESVSIPTGVTYIGGSAFYNCSSLTAISLPEKVEWIGTKAFYQCTLLEEIEIPEKCDSIASYAFQRCYSLKSVAFPEGTEVIYLGVCYDCTGLTSLTLPSTITTINSQAFRNCSSLVSLTIPENVTTMSSTYIFNGCAGLTEVNAMMATPPSIGSTAFSTATYSAATLYVPTGSSEAYAAATNWSKFTNIVEKDFSATSADYTITTAAEWNALAELMATDSLDLTGKVVLIANDIDFDGDTIKPLGYDLTTLFNGELNGNGKTISNYIAVADTTWYGALVTMTGTSAYIHDITVAGALTTTYSFGGGAVGFLYGTAENITNAGTVTSNGGTLTGGVIGGSSTGCLISGCSNKGTVSSDTINCGGVIGRAWKSTVKNCWNEGTVTSTYRQVGGVMALAYGASGSGCTVDSCYNKGTVVSTSSSTVPYTAGVAACVYVGEFSNCWNEGTVYDTNGYGYVSGVFGYYFGTAYGDHIVLNNCYNTSDLSGNELVAGVLNYGGSSNYPVVDMYNCYNTGNITGTSGRANGVANAYTPGGTYSGCYNTGTIVGNGQNTAGLFGYYRGATPGDSSLTTFKGCYNTGNVTSTYSTYAYAYTAGVVAYDCGYTTIDSCYNTGDVTSNCYYVGGITSFIKVGSTTNDKVTNCYNTGDITAEISGTSFYGRAGGIFGYSTALDTVMNVFNTGNITSNKRYVGGIASYCGPVVINAYNTGDVTGQYYVAGIAGYKTSSYDSIINAYNTGTITVTSTTSSYKGAIVAGTGYNKVRNGYYLASTALGTTYESACTSVGYAELASLDMGDAWTAGDNYTYPRITTIADNDYAKAHAAAVIPDDSTDVYSAMTGVFYLGAPDGVTWTADNSVISYDGQMGYFNADYAGGTITMTATSGDVAVTTELVYGVTTGVESVLSDDDLAEAELVSETLYNTSGQIVTAPADGQKAIYIVRRVYSDGTVTTVKEAR